jgi:hypothetical protein
MEQNYLVVFKLLIALVVVPRSMLARSHKATRRYIGTIVDITSF